MLWLKDKYLTTESDRKMSIPKKGAEEERLKMPTTVSPADALTILFMVLIIFPGNLSGSVLKVKFLTSSFWNSKH